MMWLKVSADSTLSWGGAFLPLIVLLAPFVARGSTLVLRPVAGQPSSRLELLSRSFWMGTVAALPCWLLLRILGRRLLMTL